MSLTSVVRLVGMVVGVSALLLGAGIGSASNEPAVMPAKVSAQWDPWDGRLCPREVGYGKFDQPITLQDI